MDGWSIKGDADITPVTIAGVTYGLNATERSFESMRFEGWELKFQHLAPDFFDYKIRTENAKGKGAIVPFDGQEISVWYDGVRRFKGHVVKPRLGLDRLSITVLGAWHWATKIQLSGEAEDETSATADRTLYALPQQGIRTSLQSLINRAAAMGVPWKTIPDADVAMRISAMYPFAETTLSNMSFAAAIASMMELVPDAVLWFDYDGAVAPMITRRGDMTAASYTVGNTGSTRVTSCEIQPRTDQKVARVELKYMDRHATTGAPKWASQNSGTADTDEKKRRVQIVTVSGPENVDFLPKDELEKIKLQTVNWTAITNSFVNERDGVLSGIKKTYGSVWGGISRTLTYYDGWSKDKTAHSPVFPGLVMTPVSGKPLKTAQKWLLISDDPLPEWAQKELGAAEVTITGTWIAEWEDWRGSYSAMFKELRDASTSFIANTWNNNTSEPATGWDDRSSWAILQWSINAWVISISKPDEELFYKPRDYDFVPPPAGLADNLKSAQEWLPHEGVVVIRRPDLTGFNTLQRKFNVAGAHPDYETMDSLLKSVSYRAPNTVTFELGPPPRIDNGGLVNKMRRSGKNNVKWI